MPMASASEALESQNLRDTLPLSICPHPVQAAGGFGVRLSGHKEVSSWAPPCTNTRQTPIMGNGSDYSLRKRGADSRSIAQNEARLRRLIHTPPGSTYPARRRRAASPSAAIWAFSASRPENFISGRMKSTS